jgi:hypothetical protein
VAVAKAVLSPIVIGVCAVVEDDQRAPVEIEALEGSRRVA